MSELNEAFRELNRFCDAHGCTWNITRPPDGTFCVCIADVCGGYTYCGTDLVMGIHEAVKGARSPELSGRRQADA